jgi:hypothetical protein
MQARDCLINSGQGRPRAINFKDSDVRPPCLEDFPNQQAQGELFIPYVEICSLLGDLTECCSRRHMSHSKRLHLESALYRWTRTLPVSLRLSEQADTSDIYTTSTWTFNARQLHIPYFITLTIMSQPPTTQSPVSPVAILASSFVAGIFEEFLARDELQFLGPIFTFYLLAAGVALVSTRHYPALWQTAQQDLRVLQNSLEELSKRWPSAIGALKAMRNVIDRASVGSATSVAAQLKWLDVEQQLVFQHTRLDLCRLWSIYENETCIDSTLIAPPNNNHSTELMTAEILGNLRYPLSSRPDDTQPAMVPFGDTDLSLDNFQYEGIGNWLLNDWQTDLAW